MSALQCVASRFVRHSPEKTRRPGPRITDILAVGPNPGLTVCLCGLFERYGWSVIRAIDTLGALEFLRANQAAVAVIEEALPDGGWRDAAARLQAVPDAPRLVVFADAGQTDVAEYGAFDVLRRPIVEADVLWTVATAWHHWMNDREGRALGGAPCSDA